MCEGSYWCGVLMFGLCFVYWFEGSVLLMVIVVGYEMLYEG